MVLSRRLDKVCALTVCEADAGAVASPGSVYLARGGQHLEVVRTSDGSFRLDLSDAPPENFCRPAVDVLFRSAAAAAGAGVLGCVLTGMGHDGLAGAKAIVAAGGQVIVQDEQSSVVWGMPGIVARSGLASAVLPLDQIGAEIFVRASCLAGARPCR
jgi:two-component system chemotaxis response regulator CheB